MPVFPYFQIVDALIAHIGKQIQAQYNPREWAMPFWNWSAIWAHSNGKSVSHSFLPRRIVWMDERESATP